MNAEKLERFLQFAVVPTVAFFAVWFIAANGEKDPSIVHSQPTPESAPADLADGTEPADETQDSHIFQIDVPGVGVVYCGGGLDYPSAYGVITAIVEEGYLDERPDQITLTNTYGTTEIKSLGLRSLLSLGDTEVVCAKKQVIPVTPVAPATPEEAVVTPVCP